MDQISCAEYNEKAERRWVNTLARRRLLEPASTPFANQHLVEEMKDVQKALGFEDTHELCAARGTSHSNLSPLLTGKLRFPDSYQQLLFVQGGVSGCAMDEQKYDVFFYPAEAIASRSMPVTPALAETSGAPAEGEARVFLKKARVVNVYYDKLDAQCRSFRERNVTRMQALAEKQKLFDEPQSARPLFRSRFHSTNVKPR